VKLGKLAFALLRLLAALAIMAAFVVLDWYPTAKGLGRLRRERSDWQRKIKHHGTMAKNLEFPDAGENALFEKMEAQVRQALPGVDSDDAWFERTRGELLKNAKPLAGAAAVFRAADTLDSGPPELRDWLKLQGENIRSSFRAADPLPGVFPPSLVLEGPWASQPLAIVLQAPLPDLLDFINRSSWNVARLEIIRLRLEPAGRLSRAWLVCRGNYRTPGPSAWAQEPERDSGGEGLLVDPDSPMLLRKVNPLPASGAEKRKLPPGGSPW
jgi:hypothetical protein